MATGKRKLAEQHKEEVGYRPKAVTCSGCLHFKTTAVPIAWMVKSNETRTRLNLPVFYDLALPQNQVQAKLRCEQPGVVPFGVKRSGQCRNWAENPATN